MTDASITGALAARISATRWDNLPRAAQTVAKQCLFDFVGVTLAGAREPLADILNAEAADLGGRAQAGVIGRGRRVNVEQAALINGAAGHAHDYDDVHMAMNGHPTVPVAPAVLALAEHLDKGAPALLAAFAAGVDAECIIGRYLGRFALLARLARDRHARQFRRGCRGGESDGSRSRDDRARARHRRHAGGGPEVAVRHDVQAAARGPRGRDGRLCSATRGARLQRAAPTFSKSRRVLPRRRDTAHRRNASTRALDRSELPARRLFQIPRGVLHDAFVDRGNP